ncbi:MAG TPA: DUF3108 domain-containing protein [Burkholderiales bacterium]|jgi:hypothetical protein|nr:DUF3108 domain-containing protein [Burkholderiales bacterium]
MTIRYALLMVMLVCAPCFAAQPPHRVQMEFSVNSGSMHLGEGRDVLEHDGKRYSVISESKTVGLASFFYKMNVRRESRGLITNQGLKPLHFEEDRSRKGRRTVDFDWDAKLVKLTDGDNVETVPLPDNTFDQTTFTYAFAFRPPGEEIAPVHLTDGRKLSDYKYKIVGKEKLKTSLGELETVHFQKMQEADDKRGFEVWLAIGHYYLPVQIRFVEKDGTVLDSTVTAISYP